MGIGSSTISHLRENEYLNKLSGNETISEYDPFWNQLLSFSIPFQNKQSFDVKLEEVTLNYCKLLFANNQRTGNFTSLVKIFLSRSSELKSSAECSDDIFLWQTLNALHILRHLCKFLVEYMTEDKIIEQFEACSLDERKKELSDGLMFMEALQSSHFKEFLYALMDIVVELPVLQSTYFIHVEAVNCLIVLLSVQMFVSSPSHYGPLHQVFFTSFSSSYVNVFVHNLLQNFVEQRPIPVNEEKEHGGSFVLGFASSVAAGLRSVIKLPFNEGPADGDLKLNNALLAHQCSLLLLVLATHHLVEVSEEENNIPNIYKQAVCSFRHIQGKLKGVEIQNGSNTAPSFYINFSRLYVTLCKTQTYEASTLMLYFLLHKNPDVKAYILSKTDIENLVLPVLHILYVAPSQNSQTIYMALIVLLILTEDDPFNKHVHQIKISAVPWYTERMLSNISLGDLMILVFLKIIQFNMYKVRDRYVHTNSLAALANMSSQFRSIHTYPAQKIFELITALIKRHKLYKQKLNEVGIGPASTVQQSVTIIEPDRNYSEEIEVLEEVIRMLLEIINSCLSTGIHRQNSNLVYALLQKREAFAQLKQRPNFQDVLQNIETIIEFFSSRINEIQQAALTQEQVRQVIDDTIMQIPSHYLHKFPELKFHYIEEESSDEFFVPYVWSLVFNKSGLYWNPGCIQLFSLEQ